MTPLTMPDRSPSPAVPAISSAAAHSGSTTACAGVALVPAACKRVAEPVWSPFANAAVQDTFDGWPAPARDRLLALRELILATAASTAGVGMLEETLKWGEPAYLTTQSKSGSTIRIGWKASAPTRYAIYFNCKTTLVDTFRSMFPHDFIFEGNRALVFEQSAAPPADALAFCIASALTYHRDRRSHVPAPE